MQDDTNTLKELNSQIRKSISFFSGQDTHIDDIYEKRKDFWKLMAFGDNGESSKTVGFLRFCATVSSTSAATMAAVTTSDPMTTSAVDSHNTTGGTTSGNPYPDVDIDSLPWVNVTNTTDCDATFLNFKLQFKNLTSHKLTVYGEHLFNIEKVFLNGSSKYRRKEEYKECFSLIDEAKGIIESFLTTLDLSLNVTTAETFAVALSYAQQILPLYKVFFTPRSAYDEMDARLRNACEWTDELIEKVDNNIHDSREKIDKARDTFERALVIFNTIVHEFENLAEIIDRRIIPTVNTTESYENRQMTKIELAEEFTSNSFVGNTEHLVQKNNEINILIASYVYEMEIGIKALRSAFKGLLELEIPILNDYTMQQLELIKNLKNVVCKADDTGK